MGNVRHNIGSMIQALPQTFMESYVLYNTSPVFFAYFPYFIKKVDI
jgi:hypothetical protein